jgi:hypothetical protein
MKNALVTIIILAAIGLGGYVWYIDRMGGPGMSTETAGDAVEDAAKAAKGAIDTVTEAAGEAADKAAVAIKETAEGSVDAAKDAAGQAESAAESAAGTAAETAGDAAESARDAADAAVQSAGDTAESAAETAEGAVDSARQALTPDETGLITPEGFDADRAIEMIDNSDLGPDAKAALKSSVEAARNTPEMVEGVVQQIRSELGL